MKKLLFIAALFIAFGLSLNAQTTYNFNDGSWGEAVTDRPESGSYTTTTVNNVTFNNAVLYQKDGKGQKRVLIDKSATKSNIEFPAFTEAKQVVIEASVGTEGRTLVVEQKKGNKWVVVGEPVVLTKQKGEYTVALPESVTQIRIANNTSSTVTIFKVAIQ